MKKTTKLVITLTPFAAAILFLAAAHGQPAKQAPASSTQQSPASGGQQPSASNPQQGPASGTQQTPSPATPQAKLSAKATPAAKTPAATRAQGAYRALKSTDGIDFAAYADKVEATAGGLPSGVLKRFAVVGKDGQLIDLELADTQFVDGHIKTKLFGDILVTSTNLLDFQF